MDDKFYDFDSDKAYEGSDAKNKNVSPRPVKKEFEINIPYHKNVNGGTENPQSQGKNSALKSTMHKGAPKKKKLSKGKKFLVIMGIIITCPSVALLSAFGVIWGWSNFSLPGTEEKNELMNSTSKEDVYLDISDDGTSVEVVPMYKDAPSSSSGSSSSKKSEAGASSSSSKTNSEKDDSDKDSESGTSSENHDNKNSDTSNSDTSSSSGSSGSGSGSESTSGSSGTGGSTNGAGSGSSTGGTSTGGAAEGGTSGKNNDEIITIE